MSVGTQIEIIFELWNFVCIFFDRNFVQFVSILLRETVPKRDKYDFGLSPGRSGISIEKYFVTNTRSISSSTH